MFNLAVMDHKCHQSINALEVIRRYYIINQTHCLCYSVFSISSVVISTGGRIPWEFQSMGETLRIEKLMYLICPLRQLSEQTHILLPDIVLYVLWPLVAYG